MTPFFPENKALRGNERTLQPYLKLRRARNRVTDPNSSFALRIRKGKHDRVSVEPVTSNSLESAQCYIALMKIEKNAVKFRRPDIPFKSTKLTASAGNLKFGEGGPSLASQNQVVRYHQRGCGHCDHLATKLLYTQKEFGCGSQIEQ
jgi:hypothetical protein